MDLRVVAAETARGHRMPARCSIPVPLIRSPTPHERHPIHSVPTALRLDGWVGFGLGKMPSVTTSFARPMAWIGLTTQGGACVRCTHTSLPWATMMLNAFGVHSTDTFEHRVLMYALDTRRLPLRVPGWLHTSTFEHEHDRALGSPRAVFDLFGDQEALTWR